jgi:hypothetical protein
MKKKNEAHVISLSLFSLSLQLQSSKEANGYTGIEFVRGIDEVVEAKRVEGAVAAEYKRGHTVLDALRNHLYRIFNILLGSPLFIS